MNEKICISVCNYFAKEVKAIIELNSIENVTLLSFPARCGRPPLKIDEIEKSKNKEQPPQNCILGSVCLKELETLNDADNNLSLFHFNTCFEMLLNKKLVEHYIQSGSYLVSPGWLNNWEKEISNWGFNKETARQFFQETCKSILLSILSSSVEEKASINLGGKSLIKPIVSFNKISFHLKSSVCIKSFHTLVHSVANNLSLAITHFLVKEFSKLDFQAFVYHTIHTVSKFLFNLAFLCCSLIFL